MVSFCLFSVTSHTPSRKSNGNCLPLPVSNGNCLPSAFELVNDTPPSSKCTLNSPGKRKDIYREKIHQDVFPDISSNSYTSSSDDGLYFHHYDADDEIEAFLYEENNNVCFSSDEKDDEDLFCFSHSNDQSTVYSLDHALQLIQSRPKLTDRLFSPVEDSDDCFHESEYDVIDSEEELNIIDIVDDESYPKASIPNVKLRSNSFTEGDNIVVATKRMPSKNKLKTGKVKSLPNIRFPIRQRKRSPSVTRSITFHGMSDMQQRKGLKEVDEQEELFIADRESDKVDGIYLSPSKVRSESEGQLLTSDADYLTTIHKYCSNDSHDTNIDTQGEDTAPLKFYEFFRKRSKKRSPSRLLSLQKTSTLNAQKLKNTATINGQRGRFTVSAVLIPIEGDTLLNSAELLDSPEASPIQQNEFIPPSTLQILPLASLELNCTDESNSYAKNTQRLRQRNRHQKKTAAVQQTQKHSIDSEQSRYGLIQHATTVLMPLQCNICFVEDKVEYLMKVCEASIYPTLVAESEKFDVNEEMLQIRKTSVVRKKSDSINSLLKSYVVILS